jgi:transcriptional regulator with XRE-family HTH domain
MKYHFHMDGRQKSAEILRELRQSQRLTQRDLARVAGVPQPTIAAIESAQREPSITLLSRITESAGFGVKLELVPLAPFAVTNVALRIGRVLRGQGETDRIEDSILRQVLSFRDAIRRAQGEEFRHLIDDPPSPSGSAPWDAFLAAAVEEECARRNVATPRWVNSPARFLKPFWYLSKNPRLHDWEFTTAPAAFVRHGVLAAADELASV